MTNVVAAILLTYAVITGVASLVTGAFFTRSSFLLPFSGFVAAVVTLVACKNTLAYIVGGFAVVLCGFVAAVTWAAGPRS